MSCCIFPLNYATNHLYTCTYEFHLSATQNMHVIVSTNRIHRNLIQKLIFQCKGLDNVLMQFFILNVLLHLSARWCYVSPVIDECSHVPLCSTPMQHKKCTWTQSGSHLYAVGINAKGSSKCSSTSTEVSFLLFYSLLFLLWSNAMLPDINKCI